LGNLLLRERYLRYLDRAIALSRREIDRTQSQPEINHLARIYHSRFIECREIYADRLKCDLVEAFKRFQDLGILEIITCAATHGFLPLMEKHPGSVRAQILIAPGRIPEGLRPETVRHLASRMHLFSGLENYLQEAELRWFSMDAHGLMFR
jgi:1,4-alpha-glucan branching enzyme